MVLSGAESQSIIKSLKKRVDDLSYNAGVAKDFSRKIHYDPAQYKKESIKELDQIIKEINEITYYHFSEIIDNVNKLKIAIQDQSEDSQAQSEDSQAQEIKKKI